MLGHMRSDLRVVDLPAVQREFAMRCFKAGTWGMKVAAERVAEIYRRETRAKANDLGHLAAAYKVRALEMSSSDSLGDTPRRATYGAVITNDSDYWATIEHGRGRERAGPPWSKGARYHDSLNPILQWVLRKGILRTVAGKKFPRSRIVGNYNRMKQALQVAWSIRMKIKRHGIKARRIVGRIPRHQVLSIMTEAVDAMIRKSKRGG